MVFLEQKEEYFLAEEISLFKKKYLFMYLFIWLHQVLAVGFFFFFFQLQHLRSLVEACGI